MKAKVDESLCCGCGPCEDICPDVFKIENGIAIVQKDIIPSELEDRCREAMENCPTNAISLEE